MESILKLKFLYKMEPTVMVLRSSLSWLQVSWYHQKLIGEMWSCGGEFLQPPSSANLFHHREKSWFLPEVTSGRQRHVEFWRREYFFIVVQSLVFSLHRGNWECYNAFWWQLLYFFMSQSLLLFGIISTSNLVTFVRIGFL